MLTVSHSFAAFTAGDSPLHRLDPRTKMVMVLCLGVAAALAASYPGLLVMLGGGIAAVAIARPGTERVLGLSTHTREQVLATQRLPVDYIGFGPAFDTTSKDSEYAARGPAEVKWAIHHSALPVVPIGGIGPENLPSLVAVGARYAAVISAVAGADDIVQAARRLAALLDFPE